MSPLNVAKTHSLVVGSRKPLKDVSDDRVAKPSFLVGKENASMAENIMYLGVLVDKHLSWDELSAVTKMDRGCYVFPKSICPLLL